MGQNINVSLLIILLETDMNDPNELPRILYIISKKFIKLI